MLNFENLYKSGRYYNELPTSKNSSKMLFSTTQERFDGNTWNKLNRNRRIRISDAIILAKLEIECIYREEIDRRIRLLRAISSRAN